MRGWKTGRVDVSDGHLVYHRTGGTGSALLLSHGLTDNGLCWLRLAAALEPEFDIVMLDARGHGESSRIPAGAGHDPADERAARTSPEIAAVIPPRNPSRSSDRQCSRAHP
jgi:pimeloyl-ACP methyl ester carboxylesterase